MISGTLNLDVCVKIFHRMVRLYRESYYLLEHSTDNVRLLKNVNSTQIARDIKIVEEHGEYGSANWTRRIRIPESLATHFFDTDIANTIVAQIVDFVVLKTDVNGAENGK